jgi:hypothetical protein
MPSRTSAKSCAASSRRCSHPCKSLHRAKQLLAKFYDKIDPAISDVIAELEVHFGNDYLKDEFLLIKGKIDDNWTHATALKSLLSKNTSLDSVFKRVCIPILLTYDSACVKSHVACTAEYDAAFKTEVGTHYATFLRRIRGRQMPQEVRVHLILLPLHTKSLLIKELDRKLKTWQQL